MPFSLPGPLRPVFNAVANALRHAPAASHPVPSGAAPPGGALAGLPTAAASHAFETSAEHSADTGLSLGRLAETSTYLRQAYGHAGAHVFVPSPREMRNLDHLLTDVSGHRVITADAQPLIQATRESIERLARRSVLDVHRRAAHAVRREVEALATAFDNLAGHLRQRTLDALEAELRCGARPDARWIGELLGIARSLPPGPAARELVDALAAQPRGPLHWALSRQNTSMAGQQVDHLLDLCQRVRQQTALS